jgi:hypothetical protein
LSVENFINFEQIAESKAPLKTFKYCFTFLL